MENDPQSSSHPPMSSGFKRPEEIVALMMERDRFSSSCRFRVSDLELGKCSVDFVVEEWMCNGFGVAHGAITYGAADSCLAFAINSLGAVAVSVETAITHLEPIHLGDHVRCIALPERVSTKMAVYRAEIWVGEKKVALFHGTYYRTGKVWV